VPKSIHWRKDSLSINGVGNCISTCRRLKLDPYFSPHMIIKIKKENKVLNVRPKTSKLLAENVGKTLEDTGICNIFQNRLPSAQEIKTRIDK
jgi:hypothetical protein